MGFAVGDLDVLRQPIDSIRERVSELMRPKRADPSLRVDLLGIVPGADTLKDQVDCPGRQTPAAPAAADAGRLPSSRRPRSWALVNRRRRRW